MTALWAPKFSLPCDGKFSEVHKIADVFLMTEADAKQVASIMESEMAKGLSADETVRRTSSLQMENTFVRETMDGNEHGDFLALDLGGTNYRVLHVRLRQGVCVHTFSRLYVLPTSVLHGTCTALFDYLAETIHKFIVEENIDYDTRPIPLGFTFSFPMVQKSLNSGYLVTWTKSFKCTGGVMEDAVRLLEEAMARHGGIDVNVVAILNDTTGTLMAGAYQDHKCEIGLILGTGSNASYMEHLEKVNKWPGDRSGPDQVIIDVEWGAFGDNGVLDFVKTEYDRDVDSRSNHVGSFTFEKLFSGLYMGEIVRLVLARLCKQGLVFRGVGSAKLFAPMELLTKHISKVDGDTSADSHAVREVLQALDLQDVADDDDVAVVRYVCALVSSRAARLVCAGLSVFVHHIGKQEIAIAVDGSLFKYHPTLKDQMTELMAHLCPNTKVRFILAEDGSGLGAAFVAAVARHASRGVTSP